MSIIAKTVVGAEIITVEFSPVYGDHFWAIDGMIVSRGSKMDMLGEAIDHQRQYKDWVTR